MPRARVRRAGCGVSSSRVPRPIGRARQQTPFVPDEWKYGKRQDGAALNYCVDERDPDLPVAKEIGRAVAQALLLQPKEHAIGQNTVGEDLDNLYRVFLETCDVFLGFKLISDAYPQWLAITRPYYRTSYVLATADAGLKSLADMPKSKAIGATIGTSADIRLIQYLQALPAEQRWSRFPMGSDELALRRPGARHGRRRAGVGAVVLGAAEIRSGVCRPAADFAASRCRNPRSASALSCSRTRPSCAAASTTPSHP